ncbi:MAG: FG-GAP repeat domain-containing protein [Planctomycetota bacterium]
MTPCRFILSLAALVGSLAAPLPPAAAQWVEFVDETATRLPASLNDPSLTTDDPEEKDYAWGDVDGDGDIDLVVVRKEPFTTPGKRANVLLMNEGLAEGHPIDGVLVDRTMEYATDSTVQWDKGFRTPTNDRDVALHDVDNDGWLDIVTATTQTDNQPAHLSHPRVYINKGEIDGVWQGFRYEHHRIPVMHEVAGPRFCSVSVGDVTGDGYADLYFADYDNGVTGDPDQIYDYNNKLLVNLGAVDPGVFVDETDSRLTAEMSYSEFGTSSAIADINGDGRNDIVKNSSLVNPYHVAVTYNSPNNEGQFDDGGAHETVFVQAPYFTNVGDLNQDGQLDLIITDDAIDRYLLNEGTGPDGLTDWSVHVFPGITNGFGGNTAIADLDGDGFNDVIITDVDTDVPGCDRRTFIMHNQGNAPDVTFVEHDQVIPDAQLIGVHDAAVFDIDGDGFKDVVLGRCEGMQVWMNQPPTGLFFAYPDGIPEALPLDTPATFDVQVSALGGSVADPATAQLFASVAGGPYVEQPLEHLGGDAYRATLPAVPCAERVSFYFSIEDGEGEVFVDPEGAPQDVHVALASEGAPTTLFDALEAAQDDWVVVNDPSLTSGEWERVEPVGSFDPTGSVAAPFEDATADGVRAFVTENGPPGTQAALNDVDGGPTWLVSPVIDITGSDAFVSFARWFFCEDADGPDADFLTVDVSNDGGATWWPVPEVATGGTDGAWETVSFVLGDVVAPTGNVRVRFATSDLPNNSVTEAGIDDFRIRECDPECPGDLDGNGHVDVDDLVALLTSWGACIGCPADLNGDDVVDVDDLVQVITSWGACTE